MKVGHARPLTLPGIVDLHLFRGHADVASIVEGCGQVGGQLAGLGQLGVVARVGVFVVRVHRVALEPNLGGAARGMLRVVTAVENKMWQASGCVGGGGGGAMVNGCLPVG